MLESYFRKPIKNPARKMNLTVDILTIIILNLLSTFLSTNPTLFGSHDPVFLIKVK